MSIEGQSMKDKILNKMNDLELEIEEARLALSGVKPENRDLDLLTSILSRIISFDEDEEILGLINQNSIYDPFSMPMLKHGSSGGFDVIMMTYPAMIKARVSYYGIEDRKVNIKFYHMNPNNSEIFLFDTKLNLSDYDAHVDKRDESYLEGISAVIRETSQHLYKSLHMHITSDASGASDVTVRRQRLLGILSLLGDNSSSD